MQCDHSLESYWAVVWCGAVCFVVQCGSNFLICGSNHAMWPFFGKLLNSSFMWCCCSGCFVIHCGSKGFLSVYQTMQCEHSLVRRRANARNVSTSFLPYGGITYLINSFCVSILHRRSTSFFRNYSHNEWIMLYFFGRERYTHCSFFLKNLALAGFFLSYRP